MAQAPRQDAVNRRPKDDTSPLEEKQIEISQRGDVTIKTDDGTDRYSIWETIIDMGFYVVTRGINVADHGEWKFKFWRHTPELSKWKNLMDSKELLDRMQKFTRSMAREIDVLKKVKHENIIRMLHHCDHADFPENDGSTADCVLLVLEYPTKCTLEDYILYTGAFPDRLARTYFAQILSGLEALHDKHYAHRNLKPSNMVIDENYTLKIDCFGFSKEFYDCEKKEYIFETAADFGFVEDCKAEYRSPEMNMALTNNEQILRGNHCDIFALGVTLFNLAIPATKSAVHDDGKIARPFRTAGADKKSDDVDEHWNYLQEAATFDMQHNSLDAAKSRKRFWRKHMGKDLDEDDFDVKHPQLADLLIGMMHPFPITRYGMDHVRQHKWLTQGEQLSKAELKKEMGQRWITVLTHLCGGKN